MIWTIIFSGYISNYYPLQTGIKGFELNSFLKAYIGDTGIIIILSFILLTSAAIVWNLTPNSFLYLLKKTKNSKVDKPDSNNELNESLSIESDIETTDYEEDKAKIDSNDFSIDSDEILSLIHI